MKKLDQHGSHIVAVLIIVVVLGVVGAAGYKVFTANKNKASDLKTTAPETHTDTENQAEIVESNVTWMQTAEGYQADGTPPACPDKIVSQFPTDIKKVTGVLYPGQYRGGNYKPHGGLRFDKSANTEVTVKAPFDGTIINGAAYLADGVINDVQYTFDVMNDCGIMYRVGHLYTLSDKLAEIAKSFPAPEKNNSRTTNVNPGVAIKAGTVLATAVGTPSDKNVFFDWGMYDWRKPNAVASNAAWLSGSQHDSSLAKHAICWFDQLSTKDAATIRALPAGDPASGKTSDYCE
jgi:hypothetical protein